MDDNEQYTNKYAVVDSTLGTTLMIQEVDGSLRAVKTWTIATLPNRGEALAARQILADILGEHHLAPALGRGDVDRLRSCF